MQQQWTVARKSEDLAFVPTEDEEEAFLSDSTNSEKGLRKDKFLEEHRYSLISRATLLWMVSTLVLAIFLVASLVHQFFWQSSQTQMSELSTDLLDARKAIIYEHQSYTGGLMYDETTKTIVRVHDGPIEFFGPPSDAIEDAWEDTLRNEFPTLYPEEVPAGLEDKDRLHADNHFHFEPDLPITCIA